MKVVFVNGSSLARGCTRAALDRLPGRFRAGRAVGVTPRAPEPFVRLDFIR